MAYVLVTRFTLLSTGPWQDSSPSYQLLGNIAVALSKRFSGWDESCDESNICQNGRATPRFSCFGVPCNTLQRACNLFLRRNYLTPHVYVGSQWSTHGISIRDKYKCVNGSKSKLTERRRAWYIVVDHSTGLIRQRGVAAARPCSSRHSPWYNAVGTPSEYKASLKLKAEILW